MAKKQRCVRTVDTGAGAGAAMTNKCARVRELSVAGWRMYLQFERWRVSCAECGGVPVEQLDWMAKKPRYTQRFAMHVGTVCRDMPNKAVAEMERLHHSTVKDLDKRYMQAQVERTALGLPHRARCSCLLRALERQPQVAAVESVPEVCPND